MNNQTLTLADRFDSAEQSYQNLCRESVDKLLLIPRPHLHSVGNSVAINTHPDGRIISPAYPQYSISSGGDNHYWGTYKYSGGMGGLSFFQLDNGKLTNLDTKELVNLIRFLEKTDISPAK